MSQKSLEKFVELRKESNGSFGFNIKGGIDVGCPVYIWRVEVGSIADRFGLKSGDEIIEANAVDFSAISHSDALKVLKQSESLTLLLKTSNNRTDFRGEFYTWNDKYGNNVAPPTSNELARAVSRVINLEINPGQNLGLMIRGGSEYGLGIYVTGVDANSVAQRAGLELGDELQSVNGRTFTSITHDKAVQILKTTRKMTMTVKYIGKIPADLTCIKDEELYEKNNSDTMIEEKARTLLTKSEHSRFTFYRLEYQQGFLPINTFVRILLELLNTHDKVTLLTEVREIVRPNDLKLFDQLIYKPTEKPQVGEEYIVQEPKSMEYESSTELFYPKPLVPVVCASSSSNKDQVNCFKIRVAKTKKQLGIGIEGGVDTMHRLARIISVNPVGSAHASDLRVGNLLLEVNGVELDGLSHEEIARTITNFYNDALPHIDFVVAEDPQTSLVLFSK